MRTTIWDYVDKNYHCLIDLAKDIANAPDTSLPKTKKQCRICRNQSCPSPINYLANGEGPSVPGAGKGLAGKLAPGTCIQGSFRCLRPGTTAFNGCNFWALEALARAKDSSLPTNLTSDQQRGFLPKGSGAGLSILFGPYSDYCLWCWAAAGSANSTAARPILVLCKDNSPLSEEEVVAGNDWGEYQVNDVRNFLKSRGTTKALFEAILGVAEKKALLAQQPSADLDDEKYNLIHRYIADNKIFVYNVWPWFRCGQNASGLSGIHPNSDFQEPKTIWNGYLRRLIDCLNPCKIAALGNWSWDNPNTEYPTWVVERIIDSPSLSGTTTRIEVFRHPGSPDWFGDWENPYPQKWENGEAHRWGRENNRNHQAFAKFISCDPMIGKDFSRPADPSNIFDLPIDE